MDLALCVCVCVCACFTNNASNYGPSALGHSGCFATLIIIAKNTPHLDYLDQGISESC